MWLWIVWLDRCDGSEEIDSIWTIETHADKRLEMLRHSEEQDEPNPMYRWEWHIEKYRADEAPLIGE